MIKCMADALGCKFKIHQVDKVHGYNPMEFEPDSPKGDRTIKIDLFFRPGHYNVLVES